MIFQPIPTNSGYIALALAFSSSLGGVLCLNLLPQQEGLPGIFMMVIGMMIALFVGLACLGWALMALRLQYEISRNGITIHWGIAYQQIPMADIEAIHPTRDLSTTPKFRGINLFGLRLGWVEVPDYGVMQFYLTTDLANGLIVQTQATSYFVSPENPTEFIRAWQQRQALGSTQPWEAIQQRHWPFSIPIVSDRLTWLLLALGVITCLALFGYLAFMFTTLPQLIPIQLDIFGQVVQQVDKAMLFIFPIIGLIFLAANVFVGGVAYRHERLAGYFSWSMAIVVQLCLWIAVYSIVRGTV